MHGAGQRLPQDLQPRVANALLVLALDEERDGCTEHYTVQGHQFHQPGHGISSDGARQLCVPVLSQQAGQIRAQESNGCGLSLYIAAMW
jgi:hypothetical protein